MHADHGLVQAALDLRARLAPPPASGASKRLLSAAFTELDVRSRTSASADFFGFSRAFHFSSPSSNQKFSSSLWAIARLRSVAHFGTTRSGQRCIATCDQSYFPATSSFQLLRSSFCQA